MIDRQRLRDDLQRLLRSLEADLLERSESSEVPDVPGALKAACEKAKKAERTALNFEDWRSDHMTQIAAAWVLSCVFSRFLEDNQLFDPPKLAGPGSRLNRARDEHTMFFQDRERATQTDREYLFDVFGELAKLPGAKEVFGQHNLIWQLPNWLSGDAAGELLRFFQRIDADTGTLVHDFTDNDLDTRFLGDLYQDLSEATRKKYALLQTPEFVEEFILDRTLDPALDEFGLEGFKMIDPACGSGHFVLGTFPRILERWQREEPETGVRDLVRRTLHSIHGVDLNPFAVAIARFRLLIGALRACGITRLADAPAFELNLACGDSLYHGREQQMSLDGVETEESPYFHTENAPALRRMLREGTYHCVVANPPYITPKDRAANHAYRRLYSSCHRQYSLAVPFMERIFGLAIRGDECSSAGYTGQITGNSFMKREFGEKLIEQFFKTIDLSHVIDSQLAHIPGHGTPTVLILGRNRKPLGKTVRLVGAIKREDGEPKVPANGRVWRAIVDHVDIVGGENEYVSVTDCQRDLFYRHPWSIGGGGAAELKEVVDAAGVRRLRTETAEVGSSVVTRQDEVYQIGRAAALRRLVSPEQIRPMIDGEHVRDWMLDGFDYAVWPYDPEALTPVATNSQLRFLWPYRTGLAGRIAFGKTQLEHGKQWFEYSMFFTNRLRGRLRVAQAEVATHNHFAIDRGGNVFNRTAPVLKLPDTATEDDHLAVVGLLNSSVACFWLKQVSHCKGGGGIGGGIAAEPWERFYAINANKVQEYPLPEKRPSGVAQRVDRLAQRFHRECPSAALTRWRQSGSHKALRGSLSRAETASTRIRGEMIRLQEDLDWQCYRCYGLIEEGLMYEADSFPIQLGQRAFEIVLARKMARGEVQTAWFDRHGSTPITELPTDWPNDYRRLVERRIEVIEGNPQIALIERPEYKRRWNMEPWPSQVERALRNWLLDRLEAYFDFDGRLNDEGTPTAELEMALTTTGRLADIARRDPQFIEAGEFYRDDPAFDVQRLVEELVVDESVPLLPVLRYKPAGLRKRVAWEKTWERQRAEDVIDARTKRVADDPDYLPEIDAEAAKRRDVGDIPVPPNYKSRDFIKSTYWRLRGKLDVPKERWVSFPHCEGPDGTLVIAWAGYDQLQLARAISAYYVDVQERLGGRDDPRLLPLLACLIELLPWMKQWHNEVDPEFGMAMGDYFEGFINEEARNLDRTIEEIKGWQPPRRAGRSRRQRK